MAKRLTNVGSVAAAPKVVAVALRKHQAVKPWNQQAIKRTKGDYARFKPNLPRTEEAYGDLYTDETKAHRIRTGPNWWALMDHVVGASEGEETRYILIKVGRQDCHARPVTIKELQHNFKVSLSELRKAKPAQ